MMRHFHRSCLLYLAHKLDDDVLAGWRHLKQTMANSDGDLVMLYDNGRRDFREQSDLARSEAHLFDFAALGRRFAVVTYDPARVEQGNAMFPILDFYRQRPEYDYYWKIEYDVFYDGAWRQFFACFGDVDADLLTTTLGSPEVRPDWGWWTSLRQPRPWFWPWSRRAPMVRSFLPIARLSARACRVLDRAYRQGWAGHDEVSVPTILHAKGLLLEDLGGGGAFVRPENLERHYTNRPMVRGLAPGTFVCPPQQPSWHPDPGKLYHPVKNRSTWVTRSGSTEPKHYF